ncbi:TIR-NBS-LRR type disease resistance protein, putative [Medicago truncatula]|uniref:TIR-NBS-LRR type disease resistance protein, putative n=1 Tax=Medicago truncatula TaxID=3880 RepID=G7KUK4_MEDTR|nr:TIR-NBS-LRR type disease resistance protein, putative [Medicago truncatula]
MDVKVKRSVKRRSHSGAPRIKWWHLKGEKQHIFQDKILEGGFKQQQRSTNDMWDKMAHEVKKVAKQSRVRIKRDCFTDWSRCKNAQTWDKYKTARKEAKKAMSKAKIRAFEGLYQSLGTKEEKNLCIRLLREEKERQETWTR